MRPPPSSPLSPYTPFSRSRDYVLNPPLFYEGKQAPTPTNDVTFGIGKNFLQVNLGQASELVPEDEFGLGTSTRLLDPGFGIKGVRVSVMTWLHTEAGVQLGNTLLGFLHDSVPAQTNTRSEEHTSELQSLAYLVCRLLLEKKKNVNRGSLFRVHTL